MAPSLVLLIFFTIQGALFFYGRTVAIQAAREGVSQLRLLQSPDDYELQKKGIADKAESYAVSVGREALLDPAATPTYDDDASRVSMRVSGRVITLVPGLNLTVSATAYGRVERFSTEVGP